MNKPAVYTGLSWTSSPRLPAEAKSNLSQLYLSRLSIAHRVGRVLSFFSCRRNWDSPTPLAAGECAPPPVMGGGAALSGLFRFINTQTRALRGLPPPVSTYITASLQINIRRENPRKIPVWEKSANKAALDPKRVDKPSLML